jgi:hypothetical protein
LKFTITIFFLLQLQFCLFPQVIENDTIPGRSSLIFKAGFSDSHIKDLYLAPNIFNSVIFSSEVSYKHNTQSSQQIITVKYAAGTLASDEQPGELTQKSGLLSYQYMFKTNNSEGCNPPLLFSLGAGVSSYVSNSDFLIDHNNGAFIDQSWYWSHSVNLIAHADYTLLASDIFTISLSVPVFSIVSRPRNGHWLNQRNQDVIMDSFLNASLHGSGEFLWDNFNADFNLGYTHYITNKTAFSCNYSFRYTSSEEPLKLGMYSNGILAGLEFIF